MPEDAKRDILDVILFFIIVGLLLLSIFVFPSFWTEGGGQILFLIVVLLIVGRPAVGFIHDKLTRKSYECERCGAVYVERVPPQECKKCGWPGIIPKETED